MNIPYLTEEMKDKIREMIREEFQTMGFETNVSEIIRRVLLENGLIEGSAEDE